MGRTRICTCSLAAAIVAVGADAATAYQFDDSDRWSSTATDGGGLSQGDPTTITWGLVADGTWITGGVGEDASASNLISKLDDWYGGDPNDPNLPARPWFPLFEDSFNRWGEVSGLEYMYEPNNSGQRIGSYPSPTGMLGFIPDVRIGGHSIDGPNKTLAYNYFPDHGDMVLDTQDDTFFGNTWNNSIRLRNVVMHEHGHGVGISHVMADDERFLMEPIISTVFDGPQLDDILAAHRGYGDVWEKDGGNDVYTNATSLDAGMINGSVSIGTDADDTVVGPNDIDFFSIDDNSDIDFFSFTTVEPNRQLTVTLTPLGPTYDQGPQGGSQSPFDTSAQSNLALMVLGPDGTTTLASANDTELGELETIADLVLQDPNTYFVQVFGADNAAQFYQLDLRLAIPGDMNGDGVVSSLDVDPFLDVVLNGPFDWAADMNGDLQVDGLDIDLFVGVVGGGAGLRAVAEPSTLALAGLALSGLMAGCRWRRRRSSPTG